MEITSTDVLAAIATLDDRDEHLVKLRFWHGRSWEEIARLMGWGDQPEEAEHYFNQVIRPALRAQLEETK